MWNVHCFICDILNEIASLICLKSFESPRCFRKIDIKHDEIDSNQTYSNLFAKAQLYSDNDTSNDLPLIVKWPRDHELLLQTMYCNERVFYCSIMSYLGDEAKLVPRCYTQVRCPLFGRYSFIVMEDLTAQGYSVMKKTLNQENLTFCIRSLAQFHRTMFDLQKRGLWHFQYFGIVMSQSYLDQTRQKQLKRIRY